MDDKIEVVANDTADGVVALLDTWNAEVNSLFLPCDSTFVCQVRVITVFTVFGLLTDFVCLYTYEF
jgi:hypothetical protein